jgi:hypothetical protein
MTRHSRGATRKRNHSEYSALSILACHLNEPFSWQLSHFIQCGGCFTKGHGGACLFVTIACDTYLWSVVIWSAALAPRYEWLGATEVSLCLRLVSSRPNKYRNISLCTYYLNTGLCYIHWDGPRNCSEGLSGPTASTRRALRSI